jgi:hypothetical protein
MNEECISLHKVFELTGNTTNRAIYERYAAMRAWLFMNEVDHRFTWDDIGHYYPTALIISEQESALAFKLTYNV